MNKTDQLQALAKTVADRVPKDVGSEAAATYMILDTVGDMLARAVDRNPTLQLASIATPEQLDRTAGIFVGLMLSVRAPRLAGFFLENMHRSIYGDMPEVTADIAKLAWDIMTKQEPSHE